MLKLSKIFIVLFILTAPLLYGCATENEKEQTAEQAQQHDEGENHNEGDNHDGEKGHEEEEGHNENVVMSDEELKEFNVQLKTAGPGELETHVTLAGELVIPPANLAHIRPRFSGIVKKVYKNIGDHVKKGETLAIIESNESLTDYKILSLISGTVIEMHLTQGEVVEDGSHGFTIANLKTIWAYFKVYQKDLPYVKKGSKVTIRAGRDMPEARSVIDYISPVMDEETRTANARVVIDNRNEIWKPGLFVNGEVTTSTQKVNILIPKTAIEEIDGKPVVFVKTAEGFAPRVIGIGRKNTVNVEVVSGLKPGEVYVSHGGFTLKAQLQKSEFGEGHGH